MSPLSRAATTREGVQEARKLGRLSRSMASRPPGRRTPAIPSRTARLAASSKYPNAVDQLTTRSKRPRHGSARMSPATYSTLTPAAAASARARSRKTAEESRPVTWQPRAARPAASSPCPQARSSTLMPGRSSSNRQARSAAASPGTPAPGTAGPWAANLLAPAPAAKKYRKSSSYICAASNRSPMPANTRADHHGQQRRPRPDGGGPEIGCTDRAGNSLLLSDGGDGFMGRRASPLPKRETNMPAANSASSDRRASKEVKV